MCVHACVHSCRGLCVCMHMPGVFIQVVKGELRHSKHFKSLSEHVKSLGKQLCTYCFRCIPNFNSWYGLPCASGTAALLSPKINLGEKQGKSVLAKVS